MAERRPVAITEEEFVEVVTGKMKVSLLYTSNMTHLRKLKAAVDDYIAQWDSGKPTENKSTDHEDESTSD